MNKEPYYIAEVGTPLQKALVDNFEAQKQLQDVLDKTVQMTEERIAGVIEENLELSCVDDRLLGKTDEYLIGYITSAERWREKRDNVISLITNKSDSNNETGAVGLQDN